MIDTPWNVKKKTGCIYCLHFSELVKKKNWLKSRVGFRLLKGSIEQLCELLNNYVNVSAVLHMQMKKRDRLEMFWC